MAYFQVLYCDKSGPGHEHITALGTSTDRFLVSDVIQRLGRGDVFYVSNGAGKIALVKVRGRFVQTEADGTPTNNLLALPPCPAWLRHAA